MAWRTGLSTLASSECPSGDDGSSSSVCEAVTTTLTDVLQPSAPPRFYLSARAAQGILRRAEKRGRTLPTALEQALAALSAPRTGPTPRPSPSSSEMQSEQAVTGTPVSDETEMNGVSLSVRRLTPTETELLMGWPPGHTIVHNWKRKGR